MPSSPRRRPGRDEITVMAADGRQVCFALEHCRAGTAAAVVVFFGELGSGPGDGLWPRVWGTSLAMCWDCWAITRTVATARRPHLVICDRRVPAPRRGGAR
jgi:hypothetical protein